ncbi:MAG TPA: hypothetical protein VN522_00400 [Solirubrobacterales bacterium]|nr:hypothetical protein [Solirubrobacterales bacterium]
MLIALVAGLLAGSATAAGTKKLVEGTVYDTTCAAACVPECPPPPPCGPVTRAAGTKVVCAQRRPSIVCPLYEGSPRICLPSSNCGGYPIYSGEGAVVKVRKRGSATVLATLPVVEGHFEIRLGPGQYVFHPRFSEEQCWTGEPWMVTVTARTQGPIPVALNVSNSCAAHPGTVK